MRSLHVFLFVCSVLISTIGCSSDGGSDSVTKNPGVTIPAQNHEIAPGDGNTSNPGDVETNPEDGEGTGEDVGGDAEEQPETPAVPSDDAEDEELSFGQFVPEGRSHSYQVRVVVTNSTAKNVTYWTVAFTPPVNAEQVTCWGSTSSTMNENNGLLTWIPHTLEFRRMASGESREVHCQINLKYRHEGYSAEEKVLKNLVVSEILSKEFLKTTPKK